MSAFETQPPLVQGLRPARTQSYPWQQIMLNRLNWEFGVLHPSASTQSAEIGLGYPPSAYWSILRSDAAFAQMATIWQVSLDEWPSGQPANGSSVTPFDTGGLWHDYLKADPGFRDRADKRDFARNHGYRVVGAASLFSQWLAGGYPSSPRGYVDGDVPMKHIPRVILDSAQNTSRAWTWEMRVASEHVSRSAMEPKEIYWSSSAYEEFEAWTIQHSRLSHSQRTQAIARVRRISKFTNRPIKDLKERLYELAS
jgi:hypothetical protein